MAYSLERKSSYTSHADSVEPVVVLGAGIAGLVAADRLCRLVLLCFVLEIRHVWAARVWTGHTYTLTELGRVYPCRLRYTWLPVAAADQGLDSYSPPTA